MTAASNSDEIMVMGRLASPYGVKGWLHVNTFTALPDNLLGYTPWHLRRQGQWQTVELLGARHHGKGLVVQLPGCLDRDAAALMTGIDIGIPRSQLPAVDEDEYYWNDLIGMQVLDQQQQMLGVVDHLFETGANDVMVVKGEKECLVPYIKDQVVKSVDLQARMIRVDWDPDF